MAAAAALLMLVGGQPGDQEDRSPPLPRWSKTSRKL